MKKFFLGLLSFFKKNIKRILLTAACLSLAALLTLSAFAVLSRYYTLDVDAAKLSHKVPDNMYGIFFEDINYAGDGGLYPELIQNRSFEHRPDNPADYDLDTHACYAWTITPDGPYSSSQPKESYSFVKDDKEGIYETNPTFLRLNIEKKAVISNRGFSLDDEQPDIPIAKDAEYDFSFYVKNISFNGAFEAAVYDNEGKILTEKLSVRIDGAGDWKKYGAYKIKGLESGVGYFSLTLDGAGELGLDMLSLMPTDTWGYGKSTWSNGGLRKDLVQAIADLKPTFIRFPGGCIVEGHYQHSQAYNWKDSIGPIEQRKENPNMWGSPDQSYMMTFGLGYHEYFQLAKDLNAEPMPIIYAGVLCQGWDSEERLKYEPNYEVGDKELDRLAQDMIDLIEYANGDASTEWGAKRAANGSPEPFNMKYFGIGNENFGEQYFSNLRYLKDKVNSVYPDIKIVSSGSWAMTGETYEDSIERLRNGFTDTIVDMHRYTTKKWWLNKGTRFFDPDRFERGERAVEVFMGEYAGHNEERSNNLDVALAEAAFMTGMERNCDTVVMASYAPLFGKIDMAHWWPNLIWFTSSGLKLTPSYHVQRLFSNNLGTVMMDTEFKGLGRRLFQSTMLDEESGKLYIRVVNPYGLSKELKINLEGFEIKGAKARILTADSKKSLDCVPENHVFDLNGGKLEEKIPAYSFVLYEFETQL